MNKLPVDWWTLLGVRGTPSVEREKPVVFVIEGVSIGPDYVFASGVRLKGRGRRLALKYLLERDGGMCQGFCKGQMLPQDERNPELVKADIDHIDPHHSPPHIAHNLRLLCHDCNSRIWNRSQGRQGPSAIGERERKMGVGVFSEKTGVGGRGFARWSSREGEKHDAMRPRWNNWLGDLVGGPFRGVGGTIRVGRLAEMAVHGLGMGSSETYRRYVMEDGAGGPLELWREGGIWWARYVGGGSNPDGDLLKGVE